jgi:hypothetical protein
MARIFSCCKYVQGVYSVGALGLDLVGREVTKQAEIEGNRKIEFAVWTDRSGVNWQS